MNKIVIYARVSTQEDNQISALENQVTLLSEFVKSNRDWLLVDTYVDEGKSGTSTKNRKEYQRLYNDLLTDKFDIIIVKDNSRLNRNVHDYYTFLDRIVNNNKKVYFYAENKFYTPDDALINGIKAILASEYSRDLSKKVKIGQRQRQKQGVVITNGTMWGYDQERGSKGIVINEEEAEIVRKVFQWYIEGKGFRIIYKLLEEEGIRNRNGKPFSLTTLKRMIKNEKYKGVLISNKYSKDFDTKKRSMNNEKEWIVHDNIIQPIVSEEIWNKANNILSTKKRKRVVADKSIEAGYFTGSHTYSGKIMCGNCQRTFWHTITSKKSLWQCSEYRNFGLKKENREHGCWNVKIYTSELDKIVKEAIFNFWQHKDESLDRIIESLDKIIKGNNYNDNVKKSSEKKLKLEKRKDKLIDMLTDDLITKEEYIYKKKLLDDEIDILSDQIYIYEEKNKELMDKKQRLENIRNILERKVNNIEEIDEEFIGHFLSKVIVQSENELHIILNGNYEYIANKLSNEFILNNPFVSESR